MIASIDGEEVFSGEYPDTALLQEDIGKMEDVIAREIDPVHLIPEDDGDFSLDTARDLGEI